MAEPMFHFTQGNSPLLVSMPHVGTNLPKEIIPFLSPQGQKVTDTDWFVDRLYHFLDDMNVSILKAHHNRTVIDLNRDTKGTSLYPGKSETELCPTTTFDNHPIYQPGHTPDQSEVSRRIRAYWSPYHDQLTSELLRIKDQFGFALLWDAHSIQSHVPRFFDGQLPDLNIGTGNGTTCPPSLADDLLSIGRKSHYSAVLNGRFKGGFITRHYGNPNEGIYAVQMETSQITYMDEGLSPQFREDKAEALRPTLQAMISYFMTFKP